MRLLTYNVHGCVGRGGRYDPQAVIEVIKAADADVVALQEAHDVKGATGSFMSMLRSFGPDYEVLEGPTMQKAGANYGNVLLSRIPLERQERIDLGFPGREPRGAIRVVLRWQGLRLEITATHLGLAPAERRAQIARLLQHTEDAAPSAINTRILMGDLNEWWPFSRANRRLRRHYGPAAAPRTFPTRLPLFPLDRIHVKSDVFSAETRALAGGSAARASDHLPLVADLVAL